MTQPNKVGIRILLHPFEHNKRLTGVRGMYHTGPVRLLQQLKRRCVCGSIVFEQFDHRIFMGIALV